MFSPLGIDLKTLLTPKLIRATSWRNFGKFPDFYANFDAKKFINFHFQAKFSGKITKVKN
jgi:hypothetical protein